jgi:hypothetical protein
VVLATSAKSQMLRRPGAAASLAVAPGAITGRTLTETSGSRPMPVGSPFPFSFSLRQGHVPSSTPISLKDSGGNVRLAQVDAINYWPDGSVRWCEVRGYTARAIEVRSKDTISVYRNAGGQ